MLRLAILSARGRLGTFAGALIAVFASAVLVMAGGMLLEAALRSHPPVERYAGAAAVVTGQQIVGKDHDVPLGERARVSSGLVAGLAAVPGVRAAIGDVSVPATLDGRSTVAHGWGSAALTPYALSTGRAPTGPDEVVTGYPAAIGGRLRLASTGASGTVTVVGVARPGRLVRRQTSIFVTDAEAMRLAGHPGTVDAIGVLAAPGPRRRTPPRGCPRRRGAHWRRARPGRVSRALGGTDQADRRRCLVRRTRAVHRDVRRGRHDGPLDSSA
jgi:putative ABC transport system permease protein